MAISGLMRPFVLDAGSLEMAVSLNAMLWTVGAVAMRFVDVSLKAVDTIAMAVSPFVDGLLPFLQGFRIMGLGGAVGACYVVNIVAIDGGLVRGRHGRSFFTCYFVLVTLKNCIAKNFDCTRVLHTRCAFPTAGEVSYSTVQLYRSTKSISMGKG